MDESVEVQAVPVEAHHPAMPPPGFGFPPFPPGAFAPGTFPPGAYPPYFGQQTPPKPGEHPPPFPYMPPYWWAMMMPHMAPPLPAEGSEAAEGAEGAETTENGDQPVQAQPTMPMTPQHMPPMPMWGMAPPHFAAAAAAMSSPPSAGTARVSTGYASGESRYDVSRLGIFDLTNNTVLAELGDVISFSRAPHGTQTNVAQIVGTLVGPSTDAGGRFPVLCSPRSQTPPARCLAPSPSLVVLLCMEATEWVLLTRNKPILSQRSVF
eukprot:GABV01008556.1.p1 GENE.GABV01008556.1~~GABV01008556.1.p1  ORF type:complete len:265 (-),score=85.56 GABV01008556.1:676-1470(-)